jgi:hypothetical protein
MKDEIKKEATSAPYNYSDTYWNAEKSWFDSQQEDFSSPFCRSALGPAQSPSQWVPGVIFPGVNRFDHESGCSFPLSVEVKQVRSSSLALPSVVMAWCLIKHKDKFAFLT